MASINISEDDFRALAFAAIEARDAEECLRRFGRTRTRSTVGTRLRLLAVAAEGERMRRIQAQRECQTHEGHHADPA